MVHSCAQPPSPSSCTLQWVKSSAFATRLRAPEQLRGVPCFIPLAPRQTCKYGMNNHRGSEIPSVCHLCKQLASKQNKVFFEILTRGSLDFAQYDNLGIFEGVSHQNYSSAMGRKVIKKHWCHWYSGIYASLDSWDTELTSQEVKGPGYGTWYAETAFLQFSPVWGNWQNHCINISSVKQWSKMEIFCSFVIYLSYYFSW